MSVYDILPMLPAVFAAGAVFAVIRIITIKKRRSPFLLSREILKGLLVCYITALICITIAPEPFWYDLWSGEGFAECAALMFSGEYKANMMTFHFLAKDGVANSYQVYMLAANIALFIPFGVLLPLVFRKLKWWQADLCGLALSGLIELIQPIFGRSCDTDDLITNTVGTIIGCAIAKLCLKIIDIRKSRNP